MSDNRPRVLVIPGLNGSASPLLAAAPLLLPEMRPVPFDHHLDLAEGGIDGLAARALRALDADAARDAPAFVLGESFGGPVALTLARRDPRRVRGLILLVTFARYPRLLCHGGRTVLAGSRLLGDVRSLAAIDVVRRLRVRRHAGTRLRADVARALVERPDSPPAAYRAKCRAAMTFDARPWLASIDRPALVVSGRWDPVVPAGAGRELARGLPRAAFHVLPGGHLLPLAHAAEIGAIVARWSREAAGTSGGAEWAGPAA
jgi:pimeloyl-[acyl-carrier protein] methyl ester esterase